MEKMHHEQTVTVLDFGVYFLLFKLNIFDSLKIFTVMNYTVYVFVACLSELMLSKLFWTISKMEAGCICYVYTLLKNKWK